MVDTSKVERPFELVPEVAWSETNPASPDRLSISLLLLDMNRAVLAAYPAGSGSLGGGRTAGREVERDNLDNVGMRRLVLDATLGFDDTLSVVDTVDNGLPGGGCSMSMLRSLNPPTVPSSSSPLGLFSNEMDRIDLFAPLPSSSASLLLLPAAPRHAGSPQFIYVTSNHAMPRFLE